MTISGDALCQLTATHQAQLLRAGKTTARELAEAYLERINRLDGHCHSYVAVMRESALAEADRADRELAAGLDRGPLHGIPVAVKDLIDAAGVPTTAGMAIRKDRVAQADATVVARLRAAGAVVLGKLAMTEAATGSYHPTVKPPLNPWNPAHSSGFSSSGSGVAVAAGLCAASLGTDTCGSIRTPSAFNGVTGLKPTWGRVSRKGAFPMVEYLDTIGPMARSAADAAAMLTVIAGADNADPTASTVRVPDYSREIGKGISGLKIGVDWSRIDEDCSPAVAQGLRHTAEMLAAKGALMRSVRTPVADFFKVTPLVTIGMADAHRETYPARATEYGPAISYMLGAAAGVDGKDVAAAINSVNALKGELAALFDDVDLLLLPAAVEAAAPVGNLERAMVEDSSTFGRQFGCTITFNMTGSPTITFPTGFDDGLPIAAQLVGPHFSEDVLLRAAHAFQALTDWHLRQPPVRA